VAQGILPEKRRKEEKEKKRKRKKKEVSPGIEPETLTVSRLRHTTRPRNFCFKNKKEV
jgi:hypothetical protein